MSLFYPVGKLAAAALWVALLMVLIGSVEEPFAQLIVWVGAATAALHLVETVVFLSRHRAKSSNVALDAVQVMLFGVFHLWPIMLRTPPLP